MVHVDQLQCTSKCFQTEFIQESAVSMRSVAKDPTETISQPLDFRSLVSLKLTYIDIPFSHAILAIAMELKIARQ